MKAIYKCLLVVLLTSCLEDDLAVTDKVSGGDLQYLNYDQDLSALPNDRFRIIGVTPKENIWSVIVEYSGGCEEHNFLVLWDGEWLTNPVKGSFYLLHDNNEDFCESTVRDTLEVDISTVFFGELSEEVEVMAVINANTNREIDIPVDLMNISQSPNCSLAASIQIPECEYSIWDDRWLQLSDSIGSYGTIWLQPVKNSESVSLDLPEIGNYQVGITPVFGFQYSRDSVISCRSFPQGIVIPVAINCLALIDD